MPYSRINLGCGMDILPGYLNVDIHPLNGVDIVHDLESGALPFDSDSAEEILAYNILEHIDYIPLMKEIYRVLIAGGKLKVAVPHFTSPAMYADPTHRNFFSCGTFEFFVTGGLREYYFDFSFSSIEMQKLHFGKRRLYFYNRLLEWWVNSRKSRMAIYESSPLRIFNADYIEVVLVK